MSISGHRLHLQRTSSVPLWSQMQHQQPPIHHHSSSDSASSSSSTGLLTPPNLGNQQSSASSTAMSSPMPALKSAVQHNSNMPHGVKTFHSDVAATISHPVSTTSDQYSPWASFYSCADNKTQSPKAGWFLNRIKLLLGNLLFIITSFGLLDGSNYRP